MLGTVLYLAKYLILNFCLLLGNTEAGSYGTVPETPNSEYAYEIVFKIPFNILSLFSSVRTPFLMY
jgi:hypothetical protein